MIMLSLLSWSKQCLTVIIAHICGVSRQGEAYVNRVNCSLIRPSSNLAVIFMLLPQQWTPLCEKRVILEK